jgi:hypothetical protein
MRWRRRSHQDAEGRGKLKGTHVTLPIVNAPCNAPIPPSTPRGATRPTPLAPQCLIHSESHPIHGTLQAPDPLTPTNLLRACARTPHSRFLHLDESQREINQPVLIDQRDQYGLCRCQPRWLRRGDSRRTNMLARWFEENHANTRLHATNSLLDQGAQFSPPSPLHRWGGGFGDSSPPLTLAFACRPSDGHRLNIWRQRWIYRQSCSRSFWSCQAQSCIERSPMFSINAAHRTYQQQSPLAFCSASPSIYPLLPWVSSTFLPSIGPNPDRFRTSCRHAKCAGS